jgi:hypothetical protein
MHMTGILLGFTLFGFTELRDRQKAAKDREDAVVREAQQKSQITTLQNVLAAQNKIENGLRTQIAQGQALQDDQQTVIKNQEGQNRRLMDVLLAAYQLSGVELTLATPPFPHPSYAALFQSTKEDLKASGQSPSAPFDKYWQYFETCLEHGDFQASKGEREQWVITCRVGRPQGLATPTLYCAPDTYQWRAFEQFLDMVLSPRLSVQLTGGSELVLLDASSRPSAIARTANQLKLTVLGTGIKLAQLSDARILLRVDKPSARRQELFTSVTIRSLDPLVQFETTVEPKWLPTKIGTDKIQFEADVEPQERDIIVQVAGPVPLPVQVNRTLLAIKGLQ